MEAIWNLISGNKTRVNIYYYDYCCTLFCMVKKRKIIKYILEYINNELVIKYLNNKIIYKLTYIPDRSSANIFFFECKQVGGFDDLTLTISYP